MFSMSTDDVWLFTVRDLQSRKGAQSGWHLCACAGEVLEGAAVLPSARWPCGLQGPGKRLEAHHHRWFDLAKQQFGFLFCLDALGPLWNLIQADLYYIHKSVKCQVYIKVAKVDLQVAKLMIHIGQWMLTYIAPHSHGCSSRWGTSERPSLCCCSAWNQILPAPNLVESWSRLDNFRVGIEVANINKINVHAPMSFL